MTKQLTEKSEHLWKAFFAVPKDVYRADPLWVPENPKQVRAQLEDGMSKSRFQTQPFVVIDAENLARARCVAILPPATESKKREAWLGYFEAHTDADDAVHDMLTAVEKYLRDMGVSSVVAIKNDNLVAGVQVSQFDLPQTVLTMHHPKYYQKYFKESGYKKDQRLRTFIFTRKTAKRFAKKTAAPVRVRHLDRARLKDEVQAFHELQANIFRSHSGYVPRTLEEDAQLIESLLPLIDDELIMIAEEKNQIVGMLICLPDAYQKKHKDTVDRARIISIGVQPGRERTGIGTAMGQRLMQTLLDKNYQTAEASWIVKRNLPPQILAKLFGAKLGREFMLMRKDLS